MTDIFTMSILTYRRVLESAIGNLEKGKTHFTSQGIEVDDIINYRLVEDMLPFSFQVNSIRHHSLNAAKGIMEGSFAPPKPIEENTYDGMIGVLTESLTALDSFEASKINDRAGAKIIFEMGEIKIPFSVENFILSFSLPNLYFHATTLYDMLRIHNVPLGKRDFLGQMAIG